MKRIAMWCLPLLMALPGLAAAEEGDQCTAKGVLTFNGGNPPQGEQIYCHSALGSPSTNVNNGNLTQSPPYNYTCPVGVGSFHLEGRGTHAPDCPQSCSVNGSTVWCNPNVTGCGSPSVSFSLLLVPPALFGLRRARRRLQSSTHDARALRERSDA